MKLATTIHAHDQAIKRFGYDILRLVIDEIQLGRFTEGAADNEDGRAQVFTVEVAGQHVSVLVKSGVVVTIMRLSWLSESRSRKTVARPSYTARGKKVAIAKGRDYNRIWN